MATQPLLTKSSSKAPLSLDAMEIKELVFYEKRLEELCVKNLDYEKKLADTFGWFHTEVDRVNRNNFIIVGCVGLLLNFCSQVGWFSCSVMLMLLGLWFFEIYNVYQMVYLKENVLPSEAKFLDASMNDLFENVVRFYDHVSTVSTSRGASGINDVHSIEDLLSFESRFGRLTLLCKMQMSQLLKEKFDGMRIGMVKTATTAFVVIILLSCFGAKIVDLLTEIMEKA